MTTLLNYGFTATSKAPKKTSEPVSSFENTWSTSNKPEPSARIRLPELSLPPIPKTAPLSIPHLERRNSKRPSRPTSSIHVTHALPAPRRRIKTPPPIPTPPMTASDENIAVEVESPIVFAATLFPPPKPSTSLPRRPSQSLQSSSRQIQEIPQAKQIRGLAVPFSERHAARYSARNSIGITPVNAYAGHDCNRPSLSLQTNVALAPWEQEMALTPIEMDLGALEVIASLPETACPARKQSVARASLRKSVYRPGSRSSVVAVELPGGSLITVITPEQSAWQRAPYVPGAIRLEPKIRTERSPLAIIQEAVDAELGLDKEKVAAEQAIIDELVSFVGSFGDDFKVEETGIDAFWVDLPPPRSPVQNNWDFLSPLSIASTLVQSPPAAGALRLSKCGSNALEESFDRSGDLNEPEIIRDPPSASLRRASFASSNHSGSSRTIVSTQSSISTHSPPQTKHPYSSAHSLQSLGYASFGVPMSAMSTSSPRKVRQVKGKGVTSSGQKTSFRGLIRSAASIV